MRVGGMAYNRMVYDMWQAESNAKSALRFHFESIVCDPRNFELWNTCIRSISEEWPLAFKEVGNEFPDLVERFFLDVMFEVTKALKPIKIPVKSG